MKKSLLLLPLACTLVLVSCKKEDTSGDASSLAVSTDQKALVMKFSATWCGPCGSNAVPVSNQLHDNYPYTVNAVHFQCGSSGTPDQTMPSNVKAPGHNAAQSAYGVTGIPQFIAGVKEVSTSYSTVSAEVNTMIAPATVAGIGVTKSISGTTMTINWKAKFFADYPDGAKLALYVIENNVPITSQAGSPNTKSLSNVFRGVPNSWTWTGQTISAGAVAAGTPFEGTATYTLISDVKTPDNLEVVAVLYSNKMNGNIPSAYINSNSTATH